MKQKSKILNPGSDEAIDAGCTCAILDNGHGNGYMGQKGIFVMSSNCPIHGEECKKNIERKTKQI